MVAAEAEDDAPGSGRAQIDVLVRRCNALDVNVLIRSAYRLMDTTPEHLRLPEDKLRPLLTDTTSTTKKKSGGGGGGGGGAESQFSSPHYAPFTEFPRVALDLHIAERKQIKEEEEDIARRRRIVHELEERTRAMQAQEAHWAVERQRLTEATLARAEDVRRVEAEAARAKTVLADRAKEERLKQVALVEAQYRANLASLQEELARELTLAERQVAHKRALADVDHRNAMEEEQLKAVEFAAQQRMWELDEGAAREATVRRVRGSVLSRQQESALAAKKRELAWAGEEEVMAAKKAAETERRARDAAVAEELATVQEAALLQGEHEALAVVADVELEQKRRLRRMAELATLEETRAGENRKAREKALLRQEEDQHTVLVLEMQKAAEAAGQRRQAALDQAEAKREREALALAARVQAVEQTARWREREAALTAHRKELERQGQKEEAALRELLTAVEAERVRDQETERELAIREEALAGRLAHLEKLAAEEEKVEHEERAGFQRFREELLNRQAESAGATRRAHDETVARLALEREKQLLTLDQEWRKKVQREEMLALERDQRLLETAQAKFKAQAERRERALAKEVADLKRKAQVARDQADAAETDVGRAIAEELSRLEELSLDDDDEEDDEEEDDGLMGLGHLSAGNARIRKEAARLGRSRIRAAIAGEDEDEDSAASSSDDEDEVLAACCRVCGCDCGHDVSCPCCRGGCPGRRRRAAASMDTDPTTTTSSGTTTTTTSSSDMTSSSSSGGGSALSALSTSMSDTDLGRGTPVRPVPQAWTWTEGERLAAGSSSTKATNQSGLGYGLHGAVPVSARKKEVPASGSSSSNSNSSSNNNAKDGRTEMISTQGPSHTSANASPLRGSSLNSPTGLRAAAATYMDSSPSGISGETGRERGSMQQQQQEEEEEEGRVASSSSNDGDGTQRGDLSHYEDILAELAAIDAKLETTLNKADHKKE